MGRLPGADNPARPNRNRVVAGVRGRAGAGGRGMRVVHRHVRVWWRPGRSTCRSDPISVEIMERVSRVLLPALGGFTLLVASAGSAVALPSGDGGGGGGGGGGQNLSNAPAESAPAESGAAVVPEALSKSPSTIMLWCWYCPSTILPWCWYWISRR